MIACMRTTVTLEPDVVRLVRDTMHRSRRSFKETVNGGLRAGLGRRPSSTKPAAFEVKARPMGWRTGIDPASMNKLADELEIKAFMDKAGRRNKR
jgi:hypothetical protein